MNRNPLKRTHRNGMALMSVMVIFVVIATSVLTIALKTRTNITRLSYLLDAIQAQEYAYAGEALARKILMDDAARSPDADYSGQSWAQPNTLTVGNTSLSLSIEDLQSRLNLNACVAGDTVATKALQQLITQLGISLDATLFLSELSNLASSMGYLPPGYNQGFVIPSVGSLHAIALADSQDMQTLLNYAYPLPDRSGSLNVNTARDVVLRAYISDASLLEKIAKIKSTHGYITESQLRSLGSNTNGLTVKSGYFLLSSRVQYNNHVVQMRSILHKIATPEGAKIVTISRNVSNF